MFIIIISERLPGVAVFKMNFKCTNQIIVAFVWIRSWSSKSLRAGGGLFDADVRTVPKGRVPVLLG